MSQTVRSDARSARGQSHPRTASGIPFPHRRRGGHHRRQSVVRARPGLTAQLAMPDRAPALLDGNARGSWSNDPAPHTPLAAERGTTRVPAKDMSRYLPRTRGTGAWPDAADCIGSGDPVARPVDVLLQYRSNANRQLHRGSVAFSRLFNGWLKRCAFTRLLA